MITLEKTRKIYLYLCKPDTLTNIVAFVEEKQLNCLKE